MSTKAQVYQIKITLEYSKPPIWRRVQVRDDATLAELHGVIQAVMGWYNAHLHQFIVGGTYFGVPDPGYDDWMEMNDEAEVTLSSLVPGKGFKFAYEYDFGDSWSHEIRIEKILTPEEGVVYPVCVKGRRACPPEDVGGVWGYDEFLKAIADPDHPEHDSYLEWWGGEFDPEAFDLQQANVALGHLRE